MNPDHLVDQARGLADPGGRKPRQADLARAVSAAYYALFHALCADCADQLIGAGWRLGPTWLRVYRSVEHARAKRQCQAAAQDNALDLGAGIRDFAANFVELQERRHRAGYDPSTRLTRIEALDLVGRAETALTSLRAAPHEERKRLAALVLFRPR